MYCLAEDEYYDLFYLRYHINKWEILIFEPANRGTDSWTTGTLYANCKTTINKMSGMIKGQYPDWYIKSKIETMNASKGIKTAEKLKFIQIDLDALKRNSLKILAAH